MTASRAKTRARQLVAVAAAAQTVAPVAVAGWRWWHKHATWTVSVPDDVDGYPALRDTVLALVPQYRRRALTVHQDAGQLATALDAGLGVTAIINNHRVRATIQRETAPGSHDTPPTVHETLVFSASSPLVQADVQAFVAQVLAEARTPRLALVVHWSIRAQHALPTRPIETVVLRAGQMDRITKDLQAFLASEAKYACLGRPWRRGLLLWGPPGTGKTSLVHALATHLGLSIYAIPFNDVQNDSELFDLASKIPPRSLVLFEDIDRFVPKDGGLSLAGLLNFIDGLWTPVGAVIVATTNHPDRLDPALVRPGRFDRAEELGPLDLDMARRMLALHDADTGRAGDFVGRTPAELIQTLETEAA